MCIFFSNQTLGKRLFAKSINMRLPWHPQKMIKLQKRKKKIPKGLSCQVSHKESLFYSYVYVVLGVCTEKKKHTRVFTKAYSIPIFKSAFQVLSLKKNFKELSWVAVNIWVNFFLQLFSKQRRNTLYSYCLHNNFSTIHKIKI